MDKILDWIFGQIFGPLFWPWYFPGGFTHFYGTTIAINFDFARISKTNLETSVEYLQSHFLNHPACFFLKQTTFKQIDLLAWVLRYPAHCTGLELLPKPPQKKIWYILHPKYMSFSCFPIISRLQSESLYFKEIGVTHAISVILKQADCMLFQVSADKLCYVSTILLHISWKYFMWHFVTFGYLAKMYLLQVVMCFLACCLFWLTKFSIWRFSN